MNSFTGDSSSVNGNFNNSKDRYIGSSSCRDGN